MPKPAINGDRAGDCRDETVPRARRLLHAAASAVELRAAQSVLFVADYGLSLRQTADMLGCSVSTVGRLRRWLKKTPPDGGALHARWGGRRRQNMSFVEERRFLNMFKDQATRGRGIAVKAIWQAYEAVLGRAVPDSTIYRLLQRHGLHTGSRRSISSS
ncbi:MAG TPA: helix-turn-helix domain-containing protein [Candidatus Binataceae bacterium]|nr:helix-turn-helix domain-containing protein [Candidatus Binataceae bacterium]